MKKYSHSFYRTNHNGFTLIEMLAAAIIVAIVAAISAPNLMALFNHHKVRNAMTIINGAVKEAQKQAIRQGITCTITINTGAGTITSNPASCLPEQRNIDDDPQNTDNVIIRTNLLTPGGPADSIQFSSKGNTISGGTIVVSSNFTDTQSCFVISTGLGITRTGDYTGAQIGPVNAGQCDSN